MEDSYRELAEDLIHFVEETHRLVGGPYEDAHQSTLAPFRNRLRSLDQRNQDDDLR